MGIIYQQFKSIIYPNEKFLPLKIKLVHPNAQLPSKGTPGAAGYDLYSCESKIVPAKGKAMINIGIQLDIPINNYGRVAPRSGITWKNFIDVGAGVIDSDFRGDRKSLLYINPTLVCVILFNFSNEDFQVNANDRIAQLIIEKITPTSIVIVTNLDETKRGDGKLGSTGMNTTNIPLSQNSKSE